jgi:hypothetical protein
MEHRHTPEEERRIRDAALDETLAGTFPASDPPSTLPNPDDDAIVSDEPDSTVGPPPRSS